MQQEQENFYLNKSEPTKSCLLTLHDIIIQYNDNIKPCWKYRMPMFCINNKMFCYLWTDKKTMNHILVLLMEILLNTLNWYKVIEKEWKPFILILMRILILNWLMNYLVWQWKFKVCELISRKDRKVIVFTDNAKLAKFGIYGSTKKMVSRLWNHFHLSNYSSTTYLVKNIVVAMSFLRRQKSSI